MFHSRINELQCGQAVSLANLASIPTREISLLFGSMQMTPQEIARGFCALAATAGRLSAQDRIGFSNAAALLNKVTDLVESCSAEAFQAWFNSRGDSDFAIARDFICFERQFGGAHSEIVQSIKERFKMAVATRVGDKTFDPYTDTMSGHGSDAISLDLVNITPPISRPGRN